MGIEKMKISVLGSTGAMGRFVIKAALQAGHVVQNKVSSRDNISNLFDDANCIIDFSCPMATESMLEYIMKNEKNIPVVIGTTGLSKMHLDLMENCSKFTQIFYAPNMSVLVSIMNMMVYSLSKLLGDDFDVEIFDIHHKLKKDAPSGTALMFGKTVAKARKQNFADIANFVRYGIIEQRQKGEIGFSVQRCGKVIGTHEVKFMGEYEDVAMTHCAHSKEIFAKGAVKVAYWIGEQPPGLYNMNDFTKDMILPAVKTLYKDFFARNI